MIMRPLLAFLVSLALAALVPAAVRAQEGTPPAEIAGAWDLVIDGLPIFRFEIESLPNAQWRGRWSRPQTFNSNGDAFYNIRPGVRTTTSMTALAVDGAVELAFDDPRPGAVPDIFSFRLVGPDTVEMTYVGTGLAPYTLVRASAGQRLGGWDERRIYSRLVPRADDQRSQVQTGD